MNQEHEIVLYQMDNTNVCVRVIYKDETFWLTQKAMAELFECTCDNISLHSKNIYKEGELEENSTAEIFSVVQKEGNRDVRRNITCYNLDAIIAVGYRVNSKKATRFRQWATKTLKEYITKDSNQPEGSGQGDGENPVFLSAMSAKSKNRTSYFMINVL